MSNRAEISITRSDVRHATVRGAFPVVSDSSKMHLSLTGAPRGFVYLSSSSGEGDKHAHHVVHIHHSQVDEFCELLQDLKKSAIKDDRSSY